MGWGADAIMSLARDPFYQAFHGLYRRYGEAEFGARVREILSRAGVTRVNVVEATPPPAELVEIQLPPSAPRRDDHA
jgi:hypothetical protein